MLESLLRDFRFQIPDGFSFYQAIYLGEPQEAAGLKLRLVKTKIMFRPNVVVSVGRLGSEGESALEDFVAEQTALLSKAPNYQVLDKKKLPGLKPACLVRQSLRNAEGVGVEQMQLYVALDDRKLLIVTATHLPGDDFKKYEGTFLKLMASLQDAEGRALLPGFT